MLFQNPSIFENAIPLDGQTFNMGSRSNRVNNISNSLGENTIINKSAGPIMIYDFDFNL